MHAVLLWQIDVRGHRRETRRTQLTVNSFNLQQKQLVKITGAVCGAAYLATIIVFLTHCHPLPRLWQVYPYPGGELPQKLHSARSNSTLTGGR